MAISPSPFVPTNLDRQQQPSGDADQAANQNPREPDAQDTRDGKLESDDHGTEPTAERHEQTP